jgi:capsular polysaccharide biosynthesis protein
MPTHAQDRPPLWAATRLQIKRQWQSTLDLMLEHLAKLLLHETIVQLYIASFTAFVILSDCYVTQSEIQVSMRRYDANINVAFD